MPAVVLCLGEEAGWRIAGLTLLDRLLVSLDRAGFAPLTIVADRALPEIKRTVDLGIEFTVVPRLPAWEGPTLVASAVVLVQAADLRQLRQGEEMVLAAESGHLPVGVISSWSREGEVEELLARLEDLPAAPASGVAYRINGRPSAIAAEKALWASLSSSTDGLVDKWFNRPCGRLLSKMFVHTPVTPNAISLASILIGVGSGWFFARGEYFSLILGGLLFQLSAIVDCVDGDIARALYKESPLGKWLDIVGDQVVHITVFISIALGVAQAGPSPIALWLGLAAGAGAILSFAVVLRGLRNPRLLGEGQLQKIINAATNRDFSVLVLALACLNQLGWFLWLAAVGSHIFWIAAWAVQLRLAQPATEPGCPPQPG